MQDKLLVVLRVCPSLCKKAIGFASKLEMVRATSKTLIDAVFEINAHTNLVVILDGCGKEYEKLFIDAIAEKSSLIDLEFIHTESIGNAATWNLQVEIAQRKQYDAKYVFFTEDDYLFSKNALVAMMDFLDSGRGDFVSPLDHPGLYRADSVEGDSAEIVVSKYGHWRTVCNTCMTFMMRRDLVPQILSQSSMYQYNCSDGAFWTLLLKLRIYNPFTWLRAAYALIRYGFNRNYGSFYHTYAHIAWHQGIKPFFYKRYTLWTPIPTLAVHINTSSLPLHAEQFFNEEDRANVQAATLSYLTL